MANVRLSELAERTSGVLSGGDLVIDGVSIDSRTLSRGDVFIALQGPNFDGHDYVLAAEAAGAKASIVSKEVEGSSQATLLVRNTQTALTQLAKIAREEFTGKVAAVTGSCGKTTIKGMVKSIGDTFGNCLATRGNLNNQLGVPLTLAGLDNTQHFAIIEAGTSEPGEISLLGKLIRPHVALVSNVMPAHIEGFGSLENIAMEKAAIYESLENKGAALINLDDASADMFMRRAGKSKKIGMTLRENAPARPGIDEQVEGKIIGVDEFGRSTIAVSLQGAVFEITPGVVGAHNALNALAALTIASELGANRENIIQGLAKFQGEKRRMQVKRVQAGATIVDDCYNANPGSMLAAIDYLKKFDDAILVMGDIAELGAIAKAEHRRIGEYAKENALAGLYATGPLAKKAVKVFGVNGVWCETKEELLSKLQSRINEKSVVLVKGSRSARMETVVDALVQGGDT